MFENLYGGGSEIHERHRHRYEINPEYIQRLEAKGLQFVGRDDKGERMEIFELPIHQVSQVLLIHIMLEFSIIRNSRGNVSFGYLC